MNLIRTVMTPQPDSHDQLYLEMRFRQLQPLKACNKLTEKYVRLPADDFRAKLWEIRQRVDFDPERARQDHDSDEGRLELFRSWLAGAAESVSGQTALPESSRRWKFSTTVVASLFVRNVCDFAGHAWIYRGNDNLSYDFMPNMSSWILKTELFVEDLICDILLPLKEGVEGKAFKREPVPSYWRNSCGKNHLFGPYNVIKQQMPAGLKAGIYKFFPNPGFNTHNCLTWAAAVLEIKHPGWFDGIEARDAEKAARLREPFFKTGFMREVQVILEPETKSTS